MSMSLNEAVLGTEYTIDNVSTGGDEEMESFLFSLGSTAERRSQL